MEGRFLLSSSVVNSWKFLASTFHLIGSNFCHLEVILSTYHECHEELTFVRFLEVQDITNPDISSIGLIEIFLNR